MRPYTSFFIFAVALGGIVGCHAHVSHPGRVSVVTYERQPITELVLDEFRVRSDDRDDRVWVRMETESGPEGPQPIRLTFRRGETVLGVGEFEVWWTAAYGRVEAQPSESSWVMPADQLADLTNGDPPTLIIDGRPYSLSDEHQFNLRQFEQEMWRATAPRVVEGSGD